MYCQIVIQPFKIFCSLEEYYYYVEVLKNKNYPYFEKLWKKQRGENFVSR